MITESAADHIEGSILIHYEGETPTEAEILEYCQKQHGSHPVLKMYFNRKPNVFKGLVNPGSITVKLKDSKPEDKGMKTWWTFKFRQSYTVAGWGSPGWRYPTRESAREAAKALQLAGHSSMLSLEVRVVRMRNA